MHKRRIALQIRAVLVMVRGEAPRSKSDRAGRRMWSRTAELLDELEDAVQPYPDLGAELAKARHQLEADGLLPGRDLGQEPVDGGVEGVDPERLG
jgi:hypothetical protein